MFRSFKCIVLGLMFSPIAFADHGWHEHEHHHHRHHFDNYAPYPVYRQRIVYAPPVVVEYVPVERPYYAPPPPPRYYYSPDPRSATGLIGGMVGGAVGYELGGGDPLAAGFGAAAGAWLGNGSRY